MRFRTFLGPVLGAALGSFVAFIAVSAVSINAFAQQVPANCAPASGAPAASPGVWAAGPGANGTANLRGTIDVPSAGATVPASGSFVVGGWIVDDTAQGWAGIDQVQVYSGFMNSGGTLLAPALAAQSRPDVAAALGNPSFAASGYSATINGSSLPQGSQTLNVYVHSPSKGWWYRSVTVNVGAGGAPAATTSAPTTSAPAATAPAAGPIKLQVDSPAANDSYIRGRTITVKGSASDPAATSGSGISRVTVFLDDRDVGGVFLGDVTPNNTTVGEFKFDVGLPTTLGGDRTLYIYALSSVNGRELKTTIPISIKDQ